MDQTVLVNLDIDKGLHVIEALDREGCSPEVGYVAAV